jgi:chemotaxis family two-component system sensor kinase Cph1
MTALPAPVPPTPTTLENCDREPIHVPGSIQPHGTLLAFDRLGRLTHASANAAALFGTVPALGRTLAHTLGSPELDATLRELLVAAAAGEDVEKRSLETAIGGRTVDAVLHAWEGRVVCEFEARPVDDASVARFAHLAYRHMDALKRQKSIDRLLEATVAAVRDMTGFDRVMAYRFRHDDSGDVVAEAKIDALDAYVGRRYPASDIPAQARRLYTINTLRLIADIADAPVPLLADRSQVEPLDLSHGVLRSVSPIHVEYLRNMGVHGSMSVSIVVGGKLWGMIACHHLAPHRVAYPTRMAIDVMAQVIASTVQSIEAQARESAVARAAQLRTEIVREVGQGTEIAEIVRRESAALKETLGCDALVVIEDTVRLADGVDPAWAEQLAAWLRTRTGTFVHELAAAELPAFDAAVPEAERFCGVLALAFDAPNQGWLVALRREQVQTIRWGGKPEKEIAHGPLGPRLTPRGSFDEWKETVRGLAEPWSAIELEIASQLLDSVGRAHADRVLEVDQLRSQLWAMVGHDLRGPLASISVASDLLEKGWKPEHTRSVIKSSAHRMRQLVSNVLDLSRLQHGFALSVATEPTDVVPILRDLVEESRMAHPTVGIETELPETLVAELDPSRFAQVAANLLGNARHHGQGGIRIALEPAQSDVVLRVVNDAPPIPEETLATLFDPFKRQSIGNARNRTGMGLGLYIVSRIVEAHGGTVRYVPGEGIVAFEVRLPAAGPPPPTEVPPAPPLPPAAPAAG